MTLHWLIYSSNTECNIVCCILSSVGTSIRRYSDGGPATAAGWLRSLWRHMQGVHPFPRSVLRLGQGQEEVHRHPAWIQRHVWVWFDMMSPLQNYLPFSFFFSYFHGLSNLLNSLLVPVDLKLRSATTEIILHVLKEIHWAWGDDTCFEQNHQRWMWSYYEDISQSVNCSGSDGNRPFPVF